MDALPTTYKDFTIQLARTPEQLLSASQLRYQVLVGELGYRDYADHAAKTYTDPSDTKSHVILATHNNTAAGTLRFTFRGETPFLEEDESLLQEFLAGKDPHHFALADRGAISPPHRKESLYPALWDFGFDYARIRRIRQVFGIIDAGNSVGVAYYQRRGWTTLRANVPQAGRLWNLLIKPT